LAQGAAIVSCHGPGSVMISSLPGSGAWIGTQTCDHEKEILLHRRRVLFARATLFVGVPICVKHVREVYRAYESSTVSGRAQAVMLFAVCCVLFVVLSNVIVAVMESGMQAGSTHAKAAALASRLGCQRQYLLLLFSQWLSTLVWVRGDDVVRAAYVYPGGHPLLAILLPPLICKVFFGNTSANSLLLPFPHMSALLVGERDDSTLAWDAASRMEFSWFWQVYVMVVITALALFRLPQQLGPQCPAATQTIGAVVPEMQVDIALQISATTSGDKEEPCHDDSSSTMETGPAWQETVSRAAQTTFHQPFRTCNRRRAILAARIHPKEIAPIDEEEVHLDSQDLDHRWRCSHRKSKDGWRDFRESSGTVPDLSPWIADRDLPTAAPSAGPATEHRPTTTMPGRSYKEFWQCYEDPEEEVLYMQEVDLPGHADICFAER